MFRIIKYSLLVVLLLMLLGMLFLSAHGLPDPFRANIVRQLQLGGMALSLDKIKLGVFEGIIVTQVRYHRTGDIGAPVFEAEKIELQCDPRRWLKGESGIRSARIKNGVLRLMLAAESPELQPSVVKPCLLTLDQLQAQVEWDLSQPSVIHFLNLSARLPGFNLTANGTLDISAAMTSLFVTEAGGVAEHFSHDIERLATELLSIIQQKNEMLGLSNAVNLNVVFKADLADIQKLILRMNIDSRDTRIGPVSLGAWRAQIDVKDKVAQGLLEIKNSDIYGVRTPTASCQFRCDERHLNIKQLEAWVGCQAGDMSLCLSGNYLWSSSDFEGQCTMQVNPSSLRPLFHHLFPLHAAFMEAFDFPRQPPTIETVFKGRWQPELSLDADSQIQAYDFSYRGTPINQMCMSAVLLARGTNYSWTMAPLRVARPEGQLQGGLCVNNTIRPAVRFDAQSTLNPYALAAMLSPVVDRLVRIYRFEGPVQAAAWGMVGLSDVALDDFELTVVAQCAGWQMFLADDCSFDIHLIGDHVEITDIRGSIYQGRFDARASIDSVVGSTNFSYDLEAEAQDIDFSQVMKALTTDSSARSVLKMAQTGGAGSSELYAGRLEGHIVLEGAMGAAPGQTARGTGWIKISKGRIFQIPLLGGLSDFLARIIPGMNMLLRQTDAEASFFIENDRIHVEDILIEGDVFSLIGKGVYYFDGSLDFTVQVKLLRKHTLAADVFRFITQPVSKMLEFRLSGTLANPCWRPMHIPKEMFFIFD